MAICPSCQAQIDIGSEFFGGLFTCPVCKGVYFIGFDGIPEGAAHQQVETSVEEFIGQEPVPEIPPALTQVPYEPAPISVEPIPSFDTLLNEPLIPMAFRPLQDVVDFANSEATQNLLSYCVTIKGLELTDSLQAFREVLTDSKLRLSFEQIRTQIKNGTLRLEGLDPAQAAVIAFRLRPLPIEMKWEQSLR